MAFVSAFLVALASLPAQGQQHNQLREISDLMRERKFDQALSVATSELKLRPLDCRLVAFQVIALRGMGDVAKVRTGMQTALLTCPRFVPLLEAYAEEAYETKDPGASDLLKKVLIEKPGDMTTAGMLASVLSDRGDCSSAMPYYAMAQQMFSSHRELALSYIDCLAQAEQYQQATAEYQKVVGEQRTNGERYNLALLLWKSKKADSALRELQPLLATEKDGAALLLAGKIADESGDLLTAANSYRAAILLDPLKTESYIDFAALAYQHASFPVGIEMLNAGLARAPNSAPLLLARGVLEVQLSQFEQAIDDFRKAHQLAPSLSIAADAMGILQNQQHHAAEALETFRQQAQLHPEDALLQYLYAEELSQSDGMDHAEEAIRAATQAVAIEPSNRPARDLLSLLYLRAGRPTEALHQAMVSLSQDPEDEFALFHALTAERKLGQTADLKQLAERLNEAKRKNTDRTQGPSLLIQAHDGASK